MKKRIYRILTSVVLATFGCYVFIRWITIPILIVVGVVDKTPKYGRGGDDFRKRSSISILHGYAAGIRVYYRLYGDFPGTNKSLKATFNASGVANTDDGRFKGREADAWGTLFTYSVSNNFAYVISAGPDMRHKTSDDVVVDIVVCNGSNTVWGIREELIWDRSLKNKKR